jgi:hypothetical protein
LFTTTPYGVHTRSRPCARLIDRRGVKGVRVVASARFELYQVPANGETAGVGWRLLSSNNRDLGRSVLTFPDMRSCQLVVRRLQLMIDKVAVVQLRAGRVDWSWRVRLDGVDVAVSSRTYQRRIQAESASAVFLGLAPDAAIAPAPRLARC